MVLRLEISERAEAELRRRAAEAGVEVSEFVARQVERIASGALTLEDISGAARGEFRGSGMTDEEFGEFLERAKHEMRRGEENRP
jgi:hypothetical protein